MITLSWLSGSLRPLLYSSSVYSCHLVFNIFCFCQICTVSVLHSAHLFVKRFLISPIFLKRSLVFAVLLFSSVSLHFSLKAFLSLLVILWNSAFSWIYLSPLPFSSQLFVKLSRTTTFAFLHFFFGEMVFVITSLHFYEPPAHKLENNNTKEVLSLFIECSRPPIRLPSLGIWQREWESLGNLTLQVYGIWL